MQVVLEFIVRNEEKYRRCYTKKRIKVMLAYILFKDAGKKRRKTV